MHYFVHCPFFKFSESENRKKLGAPNVSTNKLLYEWNFSPSFTFWIWSLIFNQRSYYIKLYWRENFTRFFYIRAKNLFQNNFNIFLIWSPGPRRARPVWCAWSITRILRVVIGIRIGCVFRVNQISNWKDISLLWNNRRLVNSYYIDHFAPFCWWSSRVLITDWRYRSDQVRFMFEINPTAPFDSILAQLQFL